MFAVNITVIFDEGVQTAEGARAAAEYYIKHIKETGAEADLLCPEEIKVSTVTEVDPDAESTR